MTSSKKFIACYSPIISTFLPHPSVPPFTRTMLDFIFMCRGALLACPFSPHPFSLSLHIYSSCSPFHRDFPNTSHSKAGGCAILSISPHPSDRLESTQPLSQVSPQRKHLPSHLHRWGMLEEIILGTPGSISCYL